MKTLSRPSSRILGPDGRPAAGYLYPSPRHNLRQYRPRQSLAKATSQNVTPYDRKEMMDLSRQLRVQIPELDTAITQKNSWAFGDAWDPHYMGRNPAWGEESTDFLRNYFYPNCNLRGPLFHFKKSLELSGGHWDMDGDDVMVLTEFPNGFPAIAFYPATRIGSGMVGDGFDAGGLVKGGPYDGARINDGIIEDRNGRMIAVRILFENAETYTDIPAYSASLVYEPRWHDQGRGIPRIATSLLRWMDVQDIDFFIQRGVKRASAVGLTFKREGGEAGLGNEIITEEETEIETPDTELGAPKPKVHYEELQGGEVYYLDAESGEEIAGIKYDNPHPNTEKFIERITRGSLASVGWFYELINVGSTGRAPTRLVCDMANQSIWDRQAAGLLRAKRAVAYAIAKGMKNGFLSKNNDGADPYQWEFGFPRQMSVDAGNDEAADRENLKMGTTSKTLIAQKKGWHRMEILKQRTTEIIENSVAAAQIEKETAGKVSFDTAMSLLEQRTANPVTTPAKAAGPPAKESK